MASTDGGHSGADGSGGRGGNGQDGGGNSGGDGGDNVSLCSASSCCVPIAIESSRIRAARVGDKIYLQVFANADLAGSYAKSWSFSAEITSGSAFTCTESGLWPASATEAFLQCNGASNPSVPCGQPLDIAISVRSNAYGDNDAMTCSASTSSGTAHLSVPLECPQCPSSPIAQASSCDLPQGTACPTTITDQGGTPHYTSCVCTSQGRSLGPLRWSCPVA